MCRAGVRADRGVWRGAPGLDPSTAEPGPSVAARRRLRRHRRCRAVGVGGAAEACRMSWGGQNGRFCFI
eukprot:6295238-Prymnesium_polylepis.1